MSIRDNATLNEIAWEVDRRLTEIQAAAEEAERRQMYANSRIRGQIVGVEIMLCLMWIVGIAYLNGIRFETWMWIVIPIAYFGFMYWYGGALEKVRDAEEPK